jgi:hypothetical protein
MRRLSVSWILALSLVFAQHGAVLHELGHLVHQQRTEGTTLRADLQLLDHSPCLICEAFAQVANPAAAGVANLPLCPAAVIPTPAPCYGVVATDAPTPRSRGPPQV